MTKRTDLVRTLQKAGFTSDGGTNHEHFKKGKVTVLVKRHKIGRASCRERVSSPV